MEEARKKHAAYMRSYRAKQTQEVRRLREFYKSRRGGEVFTDPPDVIDVTSIHGFPTPVTDESRTSPQMRDGFRNRDQ